MNVYAELLAEVGIDASELRHVIQPDATSVIMPQACLFCHAFDDVIVFTGEHWVCSRCAGVQKDVPAFGEEADPFSGRDLYDKRDRYHPHVSMKFVRRFTPYKKMTHFAEHLRRYQGASPRQFPEALLKALQRYTWDFTDRHLYECMRQRLKKLGYSKWYRDIYTLINALGGQRNIIPQELDRTMRLDFMRLCSQFDARTKHSISAYGVILRLLLEKYNVHVPYEPPRMRCTERQATLEALYRPMLLRSE